MAPVNVEKVNSVFHLFAVDAHAGAAAARDEMCESYIPVFFLAAAAREMGYYPTPSAIHQFTETVRDTPAGAVTFAAFLQFCESVAHTSQPGRSVIYKMIDDINPRGSGLISRHELLLVLTSGSVNITESEIDAAMELLDPTNSGCIRLSDLAAVLIDSCERRRQHEPSVAPTEASEKRHQPSHSTNSIAAAIPRAGSPPPRPQQGQQRQHSNKTRRCHSRKTTAQPEDRKQYQKPQRGFLKKRVYETPPPPPLATAAAEWERAQALGQPWCSITARECGGSLRCTDRNSANEGVCRPHESLHSRQDTFEWAQTVMTVDVDVQPSVRHHTPTVRLRKFASSSSPAASSLAAPTPLRPFRPAAPAPAAGETPLHEKAEENGQPHPHPGNRAGADGGGRRDESLEGELEQPRRFRCLGLSTGVDRSCAAERAPAMPTSRLSKTSHGLKCCIML
ncbi:hypothetical protein GH5_00934 [Leishmania sp. Ghana 2012 LV757]|uniref:hypothetical protein n=1 Tax=Leishmania sp. Ghana 2012 LV757 TaxID=2803181 RepID=UPI001B41C049|nr:hypothetical protein GH5_00934 [Leishmania sp. Ghana 2012 LV757]